MYVTQQGMIDRYGTVALVNLTDRDNPPSGGIVPERLDRALQDSAEMIHGYARSAGYRVPFSLPAPDMVAQWQAEIAYYQLHRGVMDIPEKLAKDYDRALSQLRDMAAGRLTLQVEGQQAQTAEGAEQVVSISPGRRFTGGSLEGF